MTDTALLAPYAAALKSRLCSTSLSGFAKNTAYVKRVGVLRQCKQAEMLLNSNAEHARSQNTNAQPRAVEPLQLMLPISLLTDSYKTTHFLQYPKSRKMVAVSACAASQAGLEVACVSHQVGL